MIIVLFYKALFICECIFFLECFTVPNGKHKRTDFKL